MSYFLWSFGWIVIILKSWKRWKSYLYSKVSILSTVLLNFLIWITPENLYISNVLDNPNFCATKVIHHVSIKYLVLRKSLKNKPKNGKFLSKAIITHLSKYLEKCVKKNDLILYTRPDNVLLSWFYPDFIKILSWFYLDKIRIKSG